MQDRRRQEVVRDIPAEVREFQLEVPVSLDKKIFLKSWQSARRGSSLGPGSWTYEHLKILMDEMDVFDLVFGSVQCRTRACSRGHPRTFDERQVDCIVQGRRRCERNRHWMHIPSVGHEVVGEAIRGRFRERMCPFQYALPTRAGTDCVGHMLLAATDNDDRATF